MEEKTFQHIQAYTSSSLDREELQYLLQWQDSIALETHPATAKEPVWSIYCKDRKVWLFLKSSSRCLAKWL